MNKGSLFVKEAINRYDAAKTLLNKNLKGTHFILSFLTQFHKDFSVFCKSVEASMIPLNEYLESVKKNDVAVNCNIRLVMKNITKYYKKMNETSEKYKKDIITPLEESLKKCEDEIKQMFKEEEKIIKATKVHKQRLEKAKEQYLKSQEKLNNQGTPSKKSLQLLDAKKQYIEMIQEYNKIISKQSKNYKEKLYIIENNEVMRIKSLKESISLFFSLNQELILGGKTLNENSLKNLKQIDAIKDLNNLAFELGKKHKSSLFEFASFEDHGEIYQMIDLLNTGKDSTEETKNHLTTPEDTNTQKLMAKTAKKKCQLLLEGHTLSQEDLFELSRSFESSAGQLAFAEVLSKITSRHIIEDTKAFKVLGQVITSLLAMSLLHFENSGFILSAVLSAGFLVCSKRKSSQGKSAMITLGEVISGNSTWTKRDLWIHVINYRLTKAAEKIPDLITKNKDKEAEYRLSLAKKGAIITELSILAGQMSLMKVNREMGIEILLQFAGYYEIDNKKLFNVLLNYESAQILEINYDLNNKEIREVNDIKISALMNKYGDNIKALIIGKSISYINDFTTLATILVINKLFNKVLKLRVYKKALRLVKANKKVRCQLWELAILDKELLEIYNKIKEDKATLSLNRIEELEDKIKLDISRSFHIYDKKIQEVIELIMS